MITRRHTLAATAGLAALSAANLTAAETPAPAVTTMPRKGTMDIKRNGSRPSNIGSADYFTGGVRIDPLFQAPEPARAAGGNDQCLTERMRVPGGAGTRLEGDTGAGWAQRDGGPVEEIHPGDVIWFPPGEKHWHGATPTTAMTHIAVQEALNGKVVDWMEQVSNAQYRR